MGGHPADHPRVCGECGHVLGIAAGIGGSSPRMRGMRQRHHRRQRPGRIIPAYAGNASCPRQLGRPSADHPRVCGECLMLRSASCPPSGSSPRMRGMPIDAEQSVLGGRIIPAYAGNARQARTWSMPQTDHPRVCGECTSPSTPASSPAGSSPRMRGMPYRGRTRPGYHRIIPAYAGNASTRRRRRWASSDHPRVCGECLLPSAFSDAAYGSSPRMRGMRHSATAMTEHYRIIPAYAGNARWG